MLSAAANGSLQTVWDPRHMCVCEYVPPYKQLTMIASMSSTVCSCQQVMCDGCVQNSNQFHGALLAISFGEARPCSCCTHVIHISVYTYRLPEMAPHHDHWHISRIQVKAFKVVYYSA
jgi:hypothetical protein